MLKFKLIHINKRAIEIHFGFAKLKLKLEYGLSIMFCRFRGSNYISSFWIKYWFKSSLLTHYGDVTLTAIASQITSLTIVYSTVYSDADQRKHQSSPSLAFVLGIHRGPVNSPHKWPVTRKIFPFDGVIMQSAIQGTDGDWVWLRSTTPELYFIPESDRTGSAAVTSFTIYYYL